MQVQYFLGKSGKRADGRNSRPSAKIKTNAAETRSTRSYLARKPNLDEVSSAASCPLTEIHKSICVFLRHGLVAAITGDDLYGAAFSRASRGRLARFVRTCDNCEIPPTSMTRPRRRCCCAMAAIAIPDFGESNVVRSGRSSLIPRFPRGH
jgi:hypothetical protein